MDQINHIAQSMAAMKENIDHVVEKVDKIDARTQTHHDDAIRHDMRLQAIHTRQDKTDVVLVDHELRIKNVENLVQQGIGASKFWNFISALGGGGVVAAVIAYLKG